MKKSLFCRRIIVIFALCLVLFVFVFCSINQAATTEMVIAEENTTNDQLQQDLEQEIDDQLAQLDLSSLEDILKSLTDQQLAIFGGSSFLEKLQALIKGDFDDNNDIWSAMLSLFFDNVLWDDGNDEYYFER